VVSEYPAGVVALLLVGYLWLRAPRRMVGWFIAGATPPAVLLALYNTACFGAPWATGYANVSEPMFAAGMSRGLMGLTYPRPAVLLEMLFGTYRGLAWLCPVVLLGAWGLRGMARRGWRLEAWFCGVVAVYYLLLSSSYYMWWGGASLGPRHAIPMIPFLCLGLAFLDGRRVMAAAWTLFGYSTLIMLAATAVGPEPPVARDPVLSFYWEHLSQGQLAVNSGSSNLGLQLGLPGLASLLPLLGLWSLVAWGLARTRERAPAVA
jgi:hypothetical protein